MDDLSGLDWSAGSGSQASKPPPMNTSSAFSYPSLRPSPSPLASGRQTPLSAQGSGQPVPKASTTKTAQDSFSNLMNFGPAKPTANLSLRERQEQLEAEKRKKEEEKRRQVQANYGNGQFFDQLGQRSTGNSRTASPAVLSPPAARSPEVADDDDLFAAFDAETKVDNASHFPPPTHVSSRKATPVDAPLDLSDPNAWAQGTQPPKARSDFANDDDPFGLSELESKGNANARPPALDAAADDDDFLGDLGKPIEEVRRQAEIQQPKAEPGKPIEDDDSDSDSSGPRHVKNTSDPFDKAVAQLVDYGFTAENARRGLTESGAGLNVQAAANWLLDDAHKQAKEKARGKEPAPHRSQQQSRTSSPAWGPEQSASAIRDNRSPVSGDGDFAKTAQAVGTTFFKTANSLWKTGQKKMQKAVQEFQQEGGDPSQPRWMRSGPGDVPEQKNKMSAADATDEAMMLESGGRPERKPARTTERRRQDEDLPSRIKSHQQSGGSSRQASPVPRWQQADQLSARDPRSRLNKETIEKQSSQAYVSPARRKKAAVQQLLETKSFTPGDPDLLLGGKQGKGASTSQSPAQQPTLIPQTRKPPTPRPVRQIPDVNSFTLQSSAKHRNEGTAHFKRGDYAAAHNSYTSSLNGIPSSHPLIIVLLCNRALTALKTGEPRQAVEDANNALGVIGSSKGEGESVYLEDGTNDKRDMKDLYGKALTRKAEALEQMEKWSEAGIVWQTCVESGVGGQTAIAGRQRCQKATAPKPAAKPAMPRSKPSANRPRPTPSAAGNKSSEAVQRLREANKAAERGDAERLALVDQIDVKIAAWRDGKRDNLRALLGSLDQVLWENSGWKKVGLHELVMANKVKIVYMKAIAKTHPDKLPQDASTEIRMVAGTVFSTLNESWDKFKAENGL